MNTRVTAALDRIRQFRGIDVTYKRGNLSQVISVTPGKTLANQSTGEDGVSVKAATRDYIIKVATLSAFGGEARHGDEIIEEDGTVFEVRPLGDLPASGPSDLGRQFLRVHTRQAN